MKKTNISIEILIRGDHSSIQETINQIDDEYYKSEQWKLEGYLFYGKRTRKFKTTRGEIEYSRNLYYNPKLKSGNYYMDTILGIPKSSRFSEELKDSIVLLYEHISMPEITQMYEITKQSVYNILKERGVTPKEKRMF
ncbi:UPF0236 family transposase-like protein [Erysipelothrix aquatica]|uniref:UPF0236 family transposase-like protein n=1 Tax=Erysipelothrix aquatica TaxID=2683714 RepID=UPI00135898FD|nr:UPF0236 family protein [Erysipelothrix aquatica]